MLSLGQVTPMSFLRQPSPVSNRECKFWGWGPGQMFGGVWEYSLFLFLFLLYLLMVAFSVVTDCSFLFRELNFLNKN